MFKKLLIYILSFLLIISIVSYPVSAYQISGFELEAHTAILYSLDTGDVLYSKNADEKVYPASLTKMLSAIILIENTADLDKEILTYTNEANNEILGTGSVVVGLKIGEQITARQALNCLLISSGGDVAYAIAHHYGGNTDGFVALMNEKAKEIGMVNSHFGNPVGLHDDETYTTGNDILTLTKYALKNEVFKEVTSTVKYTLAPTNMHSKERHYSTTNFLTNPTTNYYYQYAKGVKTGFTTEAGRCVVSTASYNGYNYLCVIMGCKNADGRRHEFMDSRNLYRWAFNNFEYKSLLDTTKPITEIEVDLSLETDHIPLYAEQNLAKIFPKNADTSTITIKPHLTANTIDAPVSAGTVLGTADIIYSEEKIGTVNLVAGETVNSSFILVVARFFKNIFTSTAFKIILAVIGLAILIYIAMIIKLNYGRKNHRKVKYIPMDKKDKH